MLKLSPDEAALLKAVCADRDNDLPRLVYADWLDDHGRPERAELIRLQVEAAGRPGDYSRYHIEPRVAELLAANQARWSRELPKWAVERRQPTIVRGFMEEFEVPAGLYLLHAPQLLDRTPARRLMLRSVRKLADDLPRCGWLGEVPELWLDRERLGDAGVVRLTASGWLAGTRLLHLGGNELGEPAARALAGCKHLSGLIDLALTENRLTPVAVRTLLASPYLTGCQFHLSGNAPLAEDPHAVRRLLGPRGTL